MGRVSLFFTRDHHIHTHNAKDSKGNWWKPFLFHHKELGHPLIIVNHAINLSVAQMNTALEMRQSLLACYVSLTQFIPLFTQDHSYVKLCKGLSLFHTLPLLLSLTLTNALSLSPSLSLPPSLSLSHWASNSHLHTSKDSHTLLMWKLHGINVCGQTISAKGSFIIITMFISIENMSHCILCTSVDLLGTYTSRCYNTLLSRH